jgi:hypothetical protein
MGVACITVWIGEVIQGCGWETSEKETTLKT